MSTRPMWSPRAGSRTARTVQQENPVWQHPAKRTSCCSSCIHMDLHTLYRRHGSQKSWTAQKSSARCEISFVDLFLRPVLQTLKTAQAVAIALGSLLELDGKTLMQKEPQRLFTGHGKIKLVLTESVPCWLSPTLPSAL